MNKKFDDDVKNLIKDMYINKGMTKKRISDELGIKLSSVDYIISSQKINKKDKAIYEKMADYYIENKCSYRELSNIFNIPDYKIEYMFAKMKVSSMKTKRYKEEAFLEINEESAYWIGFIAADGSLSDKRKCIEVGLQAKDVEHLRKLSKFVTTNDDLRIGYREKTNSYRCIIYNKIIYNDIRRRGLMPNKSFKITFNELISYIPEKHHFDFIRGYFDGDGSVTFNDNLTNLKVGFTCNEIFAKELSEYLKNTLMIETKIYNKKGTDVKNLQIRFKNDAIKFLTKIYDQSNIYLDRKYDKFAVLVGNN